MPTITVIIPVYNSEKSLAACLDSVRAQTYTEWEAICINDGSQDKSLDILHDYAEEDERIKVINQPNKGVSAARNAGLDAAQGAYITMMDSDDTMLPHCLQTLLAPMLNVPGVDLVVAGVQNLCTETGKITVNHALIGRDARSGFFETPEMLSSVPTLAVAKLFKKELLNANGVRYRPDMRAGEDHELALHYMLHSRGLFIVQQPVYCYIHHGASVCDAYFAGKRPLNDYRMHAWGKLELLRHVPETREQTPENQLICRQLACIFFLDMLRALFICRKRPAYSLRLMYWMLRGTIRIFHHTDRQTVRAAWHAAAKEVPHLFSFYLKYLSLGFIKQR